VYEKIVDYLPDLQFFAATEELLPEYLNFSSLQITFTENRDPVFFLAARGNIRYKGNAL